MTIHESEVDSLTVRLSDEMLDLLLRELEVDRYDFPKLRALNFVAASMSVQLSSTPMACPSIRASTKTCRRIRPTSGSPVVSHMLGGSIWIAPLAGPANSWAGSRWLCWTQFAR